MAPADPELPSTPSVAKAAKSESEPAIATAPVSQNLPGGRTGAVVQVDSGHFGARTYPAIGRSFVDSIAADVEWLGGRWEHPVRFALTAEAGLNDGLAFPFVYLGLLIAARGADPSAWLAEWLVRDILYRIVVGASLGGKDRSAGSA